MNEPIGRLRVLQAAAAAADGIRHGVDRFVLADDPLMQPLFQHEQLGLLGFEHAADGNAGPGADDLGDFVLGHFLAQQPPLGCLLGCRFVLVLVRLRSASASCRRWMSSSNSF